MKPDYMLDDEDVRETVDQSAGDFVYGITEEQLRALESGKFLKLPTDSDNVFVCLVKPK